jgi:hypothetical protein
MKSYCNQLFSEEEYIVTYRPIARQWFGKNIPEVTLSTTEGHPLLGNEPINVQL